jgi:hypothetical protein
VRWWPSLGRALAITGQEVAMTGQTALIFLLFFLPKNKFYFAAFHT